MDWSSFRKIHVLFNSMGEGDFKFVLKGVGGSYVGVEVISHMPFFFMKCGEFEERRKISGGSHDLLLDFDKNVFMFDGRELPFLSFEVESLYISGDWKRYAVVKTEKRKSYISKKHTKSHEQSRKKEVSKGSE